MRTISFTSLGAIAALGLLSGCATLGTNIGGDFSCPAPKSRCAPASVIDAEALGENAPDPQAMRPGKATNRAGVLVAAIPGPQLAARTGETILKIVVPAHVDKEGLLREDATIYTVVTEPHWVAELTGAGFKARPRDTAKRISRALKAEQADVEPQDGAAEDRGVLSLPTDSAGDEPASDPSLSSLSRTVRPLSVREAIAGAPHPAIGGLAPSSPSRAPLFSSADTAPKDSLPSHDALEAARQGHRIGAPAIAANPKQAGVAVPLPPKTRRADRNAEGSSKAPKGTKEDHKPAAEPRP